VKPSSGAAPWPPETTSQLPTPSLLIGANAALGNVESPVSVNAITPLPLDVTPIAGGKRYSSKAFPIAINGLMVIPQGGKPVTIDAAGYRDRRRATLESIALRAADQAVAGERVLLEPMTAVERKVVHERLKDVGGVATSSEGTEPNRYVVVAPA